MKYLIRNYFSEKFPNYDCVEDNEIQCGVTETIQIPSSKNYITVLYCVCSKTISYKIIQNKQKLWL